MRSLGHFCLLLGGLFVASVAHALDIGECGTPEAMTAKFKAEDQHSFAFADMMTKDKELRGMVFTMNPDRSVGYIVQFDQPIGDRANKVCVYNRMAQIRLFDARKPGTPPGVLLKASESDAMRRCDELIKAKKFSPGSCGFLNKMIALVEPYNDRVMFQAFTVERQKNGSYKPDGALVTVSGNVTGTVDDDPEHSSRGIVADIMYSSLPDGATVIHAVLVFPKYTEFGLAALK